MTNSPINFQCPINPLSLGAVSISLLREIKRRGWTPSIIPIGNVDLSGQKQDNDFNQWLQYCIGAGVAQHNRAVPCLKVWHINGSYESVSEKSLLLTFYEADTPTAAELNIVKQQSRVFLSSQFGVNCFKNFGVDNIHYLPLGCDTHNFYPISRKNFNKQIIWMISGKQELRKSTIQMIKCWAAKFGNNRDHVLHVSCQNRFLMQQNGNQVIDHGAVEIQQALAGARYFNINFYPFLDSASFNDFFNAGHILINLSGGESPGLDVMTALQLGKHAICLNAHAFKTMYSDKEVTWVESTSKRSVVDNKFFFPNAPFNTGSFFAWRDEDFGPACDKALERYKMNPVNQPGIDLMKNFTWENTVNNIIKHV